MCLVNRLFTLSNLFGQECVVYVVHHLKVLCSVSGRFFFPKCPTYFCQRPLAQVVISNEMLCTRLREIKNSRVSATIQESGTKRTFAFASAAVALVNDQQHRCGLVRSGGIWEENETKKLTRNETPSQSRAAIMQKNSS